MRSLVLDHWEPGWPLVVAMWLLVVMMLVLTGCDQPVKPEPPRLSVAPPAEQAAVQPSAPAEVLPPAKAMRYRSDLVRQARMIWGLDAPVATFAGQIHQESAWNPAARSHVGAAGLAQFMPGTASWICGKYTDLPAGCDAMNPAWAIRALVQYDRHLYGQMAIAGSECNRMWAALRGYNGGPGHWVKEARLTADPADRDGVDAQCGRASRSVKHCAENLGYPRRIIERHQPRYLAWGRGVCA